MFSPIFVFLFVTLLAIGGCGPGGEGARPHFAEARTYVRLTSEFPTPEACIEYQRQNPIFNCWHTLELCPDGYATFLVTDIVNVGDYEIIDNTVIAQFPVGDVPPEIEFTIEADGSMVAESLGSRPFVLDPQPMYPPYCPQP